MAPLDEPHCTARGLGTGCTDHSAGQPPHEWVLWAFASVRSYRKALLGQALRHACDARLCGVALLLKQRRAGSDSIKRHAD
ncbi:hypothetical protein ACFL3U_01990 [Pseudomonadota bacterium]